MRLYVDGREVGAGTPFSGRIKYDNPYDEGAIGAYRGSCKLTLSGIVDEVRIWRSALPIGRLWSLIGSGHRAEPAAPLPEDASQWFSGA